MAGSTQQILTEYQNMSVDQQPTEMKEELINVTYNESNVKSNTTNTNDPFDVDYGDNDPFDSNTKPLHVNNNANFVSLPPNKQMTLYSTLEELNEPLPLPYKKHCCSRIWYYLETFLAIHPRIYSLYLLYSSTWPRGLVLLDMWTDFAVVRSLYENGEMLWFMLSSVFLVLPFVLVWTVSLRFIQKFINRLYSQKRNNSKCMRSLVNFGLILYIFPPIGAVSVGLYEVYLVLYDVINGIKCFILGTGFVETQTNQVRAMKQYRRAVEIFSESIPQTLLQLWMFIQKVDVSKQDLYRSLAISAFNLLINAYRFRKEAKMNGMSIAEYALSVLQLAEIPIVRLVPRLPAIKQGKLEFINFAGFSFDKESITPIIEALNEVRCVLNTMKISIGSLINLDLESCRLMGRILKDARIRVFISRTFSLLHIKNLFEQIDEDHNGYLDEYEFSKALQSLNSGLLYMDEQQQKRIFQKLAIRRIKKRDRVYFYDFFNTAASVKNKTMAFDITQMDFPLHYVFQYLTTLFREMGNNASSQIQISIENVEKLYYFCCGLDCFDQIDKSINNHIFYTIVDALNAINSAKKNIMKSEITNVEEFITKCFHEMLESDIITNNAKNLLEMRNTMFKRDIEQGIYNKFVIDIYNTAEYEGLNIFEYCFAVKESSIDKSAYLFVSLFDIYLKTRNKYLTQQNDEENLKIFSDKNGVLFHLYNASKHRPKESETILLELAAEHGLFDVIEFFCKYLITDYTADGLHKVCNELLKNEEHQSPETFALILKHAKDHGIDLINKDNNIKNVEAMDDVISKTQSNIQRKQELDQTDEDGLVAVEANENILRYLQILSESGFDFGAHSSLQIVIKAKQHDIMQHIIDLSRKRSYDSILNLLNETDHNGNTAIMAAYKKLDLVSIELLLSCPEQDCNELFSKIYTDIKHQKNMHLWIKFVYDIINNNDINVLKNITFKYEIKKQIHDALQQMIDRNSLESESMPASKTKTIISDKNSVMKKILHFGGIFGKQNKNENKNKTVDKDNDKGRVSFKQMAIVICSKISQHLSKNKPETPPIDVVKTLEEVDEYETKTLEEEKDDDNAPSGMLSLLYGDKDDTTEYQQCIAMIETLKQKIADIHDKADKQILSRVCGDMTEDRYSVRLRRNLPGHFGKIYSLDWNVDSSQIVSASQDGKLLIWNVSTGNKMVSIPLRSAWVMSSVFSKTTSDYVASGGLDNLVSVFKITAEDAVGWNAKQPYRELQQHEGYISNIAFINDYELLSCSGDGTCMLWDIERQMVKQTFSDHDGDVECIDVNRDNEHVFASGSTDASVKIWDMRLSSSKSCITTFKGHQSDVNCVKWFADPNTIISGSDDATVRLFDLKTLKQMNIYNDDEILGSVTSVDTSLSGSYIFVGYDEEPFCLVWSSLKAQKIDSLQHPTRASCLQVSPNGYALATGCWDKILRIFA